MRNRMTTFAGGVASAIVLAALAAPGPASGAGSAPVTVMNFPLDDSGNLRVGGSATVTGNVAATQSGAWTVGLDAAASDTLGRIDTTLGRIDTAASGLSYDGEGNLRVSVAGTGAADPSPAGRTPFGFSANSSMHGGTSVTMDAPETARVTAYSFHANRDIMVVFQRAAGGAFGIFVPGGQSVTGSFHHALLADSMQIRCLGDSECTFLSSVAAY